MRRIARIVLLIAFISPGTNHLMAQWVQTSGPEGGLIRAITEDDEFYFAATIGPIYRMKKNDSIWTPHLPSLTYALSTRSLACTGTTIVAASCCRVYRSSDHGLIFQSSWGLEGAGEVMSFAVNGTDLFAGTSSGVYRSTDDGASWSQANTGQDSDLVSCILVKDSILITGTWWGGGMYLSTDYGTNWIPANNGMTTNHINSLAVLDTVIYAGTWWGGGIYRSRDDGMTWDTAYYNYWDPDVNTIAVLDTNLFAGAFSGIYISVDRGDTWTFLDNGPQDIVECFHVSDSDIIAGTHNGIYISSDTGNSWSPLTTGLIATIIHAFARSDTFLFAGTESSGLFRSTDEGATWVKTGLKSYHGFITSPLLINDPYIFAGTREGVYRSSNNGDTWVYVNWGLPYGEITALAVSGPNLFAGTKSDGVFLSTDDGASWIPVNSGLTDMAVQCLAVRGTNLYAGTGSGAFLSTNYGTTWTPIYNELTGKEVNLFAQNDEFLFAMTNSGLFRSGDDGATWVKTNMPDANSLVVSGTDIFTGAGGGVVYHSPNNGATWTTVDMGLIKCAPVQALSISDTNLFAGTGGSGVWKRPLSEMNISEGIDFAPDNTVCEGEEIPALVATGDSIKWYSNPDFTGLLHSGNSFETGQTEKGTYTYYVTQLLNSLELKDTASLVISSTPVIDSVGKTNETTCNSNDGTIAITATDENPIFYSINGGDDYFDNGGIFTGLNNGNYPVVVMNSYGCQATGGIIEIISEGFIPPVPIAGNDTVYCIGDEIKDLYAIPSSGGTITWYSDPGLNVAVGSGVSFNPGSLSATTSFYVTETSNGCESPTNKVTIGIRNTTPYEDEKICMVTIDLNTGNNLIIWEKTPEVGTQYFNIYREGSLIGTKSYHELSIVKDTSGDPETRPYLYYLTTVDSCGNESGLSPYHKPLFLQYVSSQDGVNLRWSNYVIEGESVTFESYAIYRGSDSLNLAPFAENIPTAIDVYTDNDATALSRKYYYRVAGILDVPCTPYGTMKAGNMPYHHSLSNMDDNRLKTGIEELFSMDRIIIYPNPVIENATIHFSNPNHEAYRFILTDVAGKVCKIVQNINTSEYVLEKGDLKEGFYFLELRGPQIYRGKIVIE